MIEDKDKSTGLGSLTSFVRRSLRRSGRGYDPNRSSRNKEPLKPMMPKRNFEIVYDEDEIDSPTHRGKCSCLKIIVVFSSNSLSCKNK